MSAKMVRTGKRLADNGGTPKARERGTNRIRCPYDLSRRAARQLTRSDLARVTGS
jgi:hypothetical protein